MSMYTRIIVPFALALLLGPAVAVAQQNNELTIKLAEKGEAHVIIEVESPEDFDEVRGVLGEERVKDIYGQRLSSVFGEVANLSIRAEYQSILIEFDSRLAVEDVDGIWNIDWIGFRGDLDNVSTLNVVLPSDAKLVDSYPSPDRVTAGALTWSNVDFIPKIRHQIVPEVSRVENTTISYRLLSALILLVLIFGIVYKKLKNRQTI